MKIGKCVGRLAENVQLAEGYTIVWRPKVKLPCCK